MTAPSKVSGSPRNTTYLKDVLKSRRAAARKFAVSDGAPVEVLESGPSVQARVAALASRATIRPILAAGSHAPTLPWPWGLIDFAARALLPASATVRQTVKLPNAGAQLVRAPGVLPADGKRIKSLGIPARGIAGKHDLVRLVAAPTQPAVAVVAILQRHADRMLGQ